MPPTRNLEDEKVYVGSQESSRPNAARTNRFMALPVFDWPIDELRSVGQRYSTCSERWTLIEIEYPRAPFGPLRLVRPCIDWPGRLDYGSIGAIRRPDGAFPGSSPRTRHLKPGSPASPQSARRKGVVVLAYKTTATPLTPALLTDLNHDSCRSVLRENAANVATWPPRFDPHV